MSSRMNIATLAPKLYRAVRALDSAVSKSGLDNRLLHLIRLRASQINGCAFCVDLHVKEALADGMDAQTLHLVAVWRESPFFDARDRAVLAWTESVTLVAETGIPDAAYEHVRSEFTESEIAKLTIAIGTINIFNRIAVSSRIVHPT
ncbi:carboxymuconolactone decarboxylase family protein [Altererythrobacter sp. N1]|uniref:Carboxymuconolactone decarboxylase family protein n=2 Tax=Tsuneonella suprasediminis TaxID=2306996 RepID=A0A419R4N8_9SPHN|nr:carboxymuconolactone decarboxylase family protein [Tsuneonella suprasediminis]UBS32100.1 carboxymuconolactone decarboxylase family protein [Altererythrobacter sp. N1]